MKRQVTALALAATLVLAQIGAAAAQNPEQGSNSGGMNQSYTSGSSTSGGMNQSYTSEATSGGMNQSYTPGRSSASGGVNQSYTSGGSSTSGGMNQGFAWTNLIQN